MSQVVHTTSHTTHPKGRTGGENARRTNIAASGTGGGLTTCVRRLRFAQGKLARKHARRRIGAMQGGLQDIFGRKCLEMIAEEGEAGDCTGTPSKATCGPRT